MPAAVAIEKGETGVKRDLVHAQAMLVQHGLAKCVDAAGKMHGIDVSNKKATRPAFRN